jgi:hypothetical protein
MSKIFDALMALAFLGVSLFGATTAYDLIRISALKQVKHGLKSTYRFQQSIDRQRFDWEG